MAGKLRSTTMTMPDDQVSARLRDHCAVDRHRDALHLPQWSLDDWSALLALAREVRLDSAAVLIRAGQTENSLYLVVSGGLEVRQGQPGDAFGTLQRERFGAIIGEISFFDDGARSATVWATEASRLLEFDRAAVMSFATQYPTRGLELLFALGRVMAWRMRRNEARRGASAG